MKNKVLDLKILHSGKDYLIQQLRPQRGGFFNQLLDASRKVEQLETRLLQLKEPASESVATERGVVEPRN